MIFLDSTLLSWILKNETLELKARVKPTFNISWRIRRSSEFWYNELLQQLIRDIWITNRPGLIPVQAFPVGDNNNPDAGKRFLGFSYKVSISPYSLVAEIKSDFFSHLKLSWYLNIFLMTQRLQKCSELETWSDNLRTLIFVVRSWLAPGQESHWTLALLKSV